MMPRRTDISSTLIIGVIPIVIGQARPFALSAVLAIKSPRD